MCLPRGRFTKDYKLFCIQYRHASGAKARTLLQAAVGVHGLCASIEGKDQDYNNRHGLCQCDIAFSPSATKAHGRGLCSTVTVVSVFW
jgi:hypothetical protein